MWSFVVPYAFRIEITEVKYQNIRVTYSKQHTHTHTQRPIHIFYINFLLFCLSLRFAFEFLSECIFFPEAVSRVLNSFLFFLFHSFFSCFALYHSYTHTLHLYVVYLLSTNSLRSSKRGVVLSYPQQMMYSFLYRHLLYRHIKAIYVCLCLCVCVRFNSVFFHSISIRYYIHSIDSISSFMCGVFSFISGLTRTHPINVCVMIFRLPYNSSMHCSSLIDNVFLCSTCTLRHTTIKSTMEKKASE